MTVEDLPKKAKSEPLPKQTDLQDDNKATSGNADASAFGLAGHGAGCLSAVTIGELAIGRAAGLLRVAKHDVELQPIRHHPDEAGLIGCVHLAPPWIFSGHDSILAVDIGGSNMRVGVVLLTKDKATTLPTSRVVYAELWRHRGRAEPRGGGETPGRDARHRTQARP